MSDVLRPPPSVKLNDVETLSIARVVFSVRLFGKETDNALERNFATTNRETGRPVDVIGRHNRARRLRPFVGVEPGKGGQS